MSEVTGIKETKELLKFIIDLGEAIDIAMIDKKFEIGELALLMAPLMQVGPAFEGLELLGGELKDLSEVEMMEISAYVKDELNLQSDKLEEIIEKGLSIGVMLYGFIGLFKKEEEAPVEPAPVEPTA